MTIPTDSATAGDDLPPVDDLFSAHISQSIAATSPGTPSVSAVILQRVGGNREQYTFAICRKAELDGVMGKELNGKTHIYEGRVLQDFYDFDRDHPKASYLHWGKHTASFGFDVLEQRAKLYGVQSVGIPTERRFNLDAYLERRFGRDFAPDTRLVQAMRLNGIRFHEPPKGAWDAGDHESILRFLSARVNGIARMYEAARNGTFVCALPPKPLSEMQRDWRAGEDSSGDGKIVALRDFARKELKGKERAVIEALCDSDGELSIADLAVKNGVDWDDAVQGFKSVRERLNPKLKTKGWKLSRQNNAATLMALKRH